MKKIIMFLSLLFICVPVAKAIDPNSIMEENSELEERIKENKALLSMISDEAFFFEQGYEDMEEDISELAYKDYDLTLIRKGITEGIDDEFPIAYWIIEAEIIGNERVTLSEHGNVEIRTKSYTDWADYVDSFVVELEGKGDDLTAIPIETSFSRKYEKGTKYAYMVVVKLTDPEAEYYLTSNLSESSIKIPIYQNE